MNNNKHIHDEDYDFSIKLMIPLLSILVCTICLCATTWAWYTASVSTGVTSITAKANVGEAITYGQERTIVPKTSDGKYVLVPPEGETVTYTLSFDPGEATNGYYALIDIENGNTSNSNTASILDLFVNRVYADDSKRICIEVGKNKQNQLIITTDVTKTVTVKYVWKVVDSEGNVLADSEMESYDYKNPKEKIEFLENSTNIITIHFVDNDNNPLSAEILNKEPYSTSLDEEYAVTSIETKEQEIVVQAPADYYLAQIDDELENVEQRKYSIDLIENNTLYIKCVKKPEESVSEQIDNSTDTVQQPINSTDTNDVQEEIKVDGPTVDTGNGNLSDLTDDKGTSSRQELNAEDSTDKSPDNSSAENKESSVDTAVDQTVESLLITDSTDEVITENITSSDDINSGTE